MASTPDPEQAARLRAAFAYAKLTKAQRAQVLGVAERTVTRIEAAETPIPYGAWDKVIEATGIPAWFATSGFTAAPEPEEPALAERVEALEHKLGTVSATRTDALGLLEQALPDLAPALRQALAEAPSRERDQGRSGRA